MIFTIFLPTKIICNLPVVSRKLDAATLRKAGRGLHKSRVKDEQITIIAVTECRQTYGIRFARRYAPNELISHRVCRLHPWRVPKGNDNVARIRSF